MPAVAVKPNPVGRPSKCTPALVRKLKEYVRDHADIGSSDQYTTLPTAERFVIEAGTSITAIHRYNNELTEQGNHKHPEFRKAYKKLQSLQTDILTQQSLGGGYKNPFAIFWAKNNLGWTDKLETTNESRHLTISITADMSPEQAADAYKSIAGKR